MSPSRDFNGYTYFTFLTVTLSSRGMDSYGFFQVKLSAKSVSIQN